MKHMLQTVLALLALVVALTVGAADFEQTRRAAEAGDAKAQNELGFIYFQGNGVPQDYAQALIWYRKAADQGNARAQSRLGNMYANGYGGVAKNMTEAINLYRKSAEQGDTSGQYNLGIHYLYANGVPQSFGEALKWFRKSAAHDELGLASYALGAMYANGWGVEQDDVETTKWYKKAAELGQVDAQYDLAYKYQAGIGVEKNYGEAIKWYKKAAAQGNALAQFNLGFIYNRGMGVSRDADEAVKWFQQSAASGLEAKAKDAIHGVKILSESIEKALSGSLSEQLHLAHFFEFDGEWTNYVEAAKWYKMAAAQKNIDANSLRKLAGLYERGGYGLEKDEDEAFKWYAKAAGWDEVEGPRWIKRAEQGEAEAQFVLGFTYNKFGVPIAQRKAVEWYKKAAAQNHAIAQNNLSVMYKYGTGVEKDAAEAIRWLTKSAESGYGRAQRNLANAYANGEGVQQDDAKAVYWFGKAAEQGFADAQQKLAEYYHAGKGSARDDVSALVWVTLARSQNAPPIPGWFDKVTALRDELLQGLTPEQIREAEQKVEAWQAAHPGSEAK